MKKLFEHVLILSDFDGTFAGKDRRIVPRNIEAIERFKALGGHFSFATGRLPSMMKKIYPDFKKTVNAPLIMCNGAILYDPESDTNLAEDFFDGIPARKAVRDILDRFPTVNFAAYTDDGVLLEGYTPENIPGNRWRKVNLHPSDPTVAIAVRDYINQAYEGRYRCFRSGPAFSELVDVSIKKSNRISDLRRFFAERGIEKTLICGIGDFENDVDLLRAVDLPFCPMNAIDEVKKVAHHVLCHHDEGAIADMIEVIEAKIVRGGAN